MLEYHIAVTSVPVSSIGQNYGFRPVSRLQPSTGGPLYQWKRRLRRHTLRLSPRPAQLQAFVNKAGYRSCKWFCRGFASAKRPTAIDDLLGAL